MHRISVVIPLYNKVNEIQRCLQSVVGQTLSPHEILIVDDGSTDGSAATVQACPDERVRLIQQTNQGAAAARNRGIREATGDGVAFLDADDEWKPGFLKTATELSERFPTAALCATGYEEITDAEGRTVQHRYEGLPEHPEGGLLDDFFRSMYRYPPVCSSNSLCKRGVFEEVGLFPVGEELAEDWDMWTRIALRHPVAYHPRVEAVYHTSAANRAMHSKTFTGEDTALLNTLQTALVEDAFPYTCRASMKRFAAKHLLEIAKYGIEAGNPTAARARIRQAWHLHVLWGKCVRWWFKSLAPAR